MKPITVLLRTVFTARLATALLIATFSFAAVPSFSAQTRMNIVLIAKPAPPGDAPDNPGPLATGLSPKITRANLAKEMKLVADWQLARLPEKAQYDWTFAALYTGMMAVPPQVSGEKYRDAMESIADKLHWQPGPRVEVADDQAVGQMYLEQYLLHHDPKMLAPIRDSIDEQIATPDNPEKPLWWWCDALFMEPPVVADLAYITGDSKYWDFMDHEWWIISNLLYNPDDHLYFRDATYLHSHEKNGARLFWSRGNGWVMAGIVRVLDRMPANSPLRAKYILQLQQMAAAVAKVQGADGLWRPGLLDPGDYPYPEISGSAFITYALAYGVHHHMLPAKTYSPIVRRAWAGMLTHIYADGRLGSIQPVGAAPAALKPGSSYVFGVGAYLLAGSELYSTAK